MYQLSWKSARIGRTLQHCVEDTRLGGSRDQENHSRRLVDDGNCEGQPMEVLLLHHEVYDPALALLKYGRLRKQRGGVPVLSETEKNKIESRLPGFEKRPENGLILLRRSSR